MAQPAWPRATGDPFHDMCAMVGLITLTWAWIETSLAITVGVINGQAGPIKGHPEPPIALRRRINALRVALRDIAVLEPLKEEGRLLAVRLTELGGRRHDFIHGASWQLEKGRFQSINLAVEKGDYAIKNQSFDVSDAFGLNTEIAKLQDDMATFMLKVVAIFQPPS